jgi:hypothetical protein
MLGVRRPAVNIAGRALQDAGHITYTRGRISVRNRAGLERASCECYFHVKRQMSQARVGRALAVPPGASGQTKGDGTETRE